MASVLIVDDEPDIVAAMTEILKSEGHQVTAARNGREGLERLYEGVPEVILLDLDMPVLDGAAMMRRLEERPLGPARARVILVSGSPHLASVAASLNAYRHLQKPFTVDQLLAVLDASADSTSS